VGRVVASLVEVKVTDLAQAHLVQEPEGTPDRFSVQRRPLLLVGIRTILIGNTFLRLKLVELHLVSSY